MTNRFLIFKFHYGQSSEKYLVIYLHKIFVVLVLRRNPLSYTVHCNMFDLKCNFYIFIILNTEYESVLRRGSISFLCVGPFKLIKTPIDLDRTWILFHLFFYFLTTIYISFRLRLSHNLSIEVNPYLHSIRVIEQRMWKKA